MTETRMVFMLRPGTERLGSSVERMVDENLKMEPKNRKKFTDIWYTVINK